MKASMTFMLVAVLLLGSMVSADDGWRATRPQPADVLPTATAGSTQYLAQLPTATPTGITAVDDADNAPVVHMVSAAMAPPERPLVRTASYVRQISGDEMYGRLETVSEVQPAAQLQPVPSSAAMYTAQVPANLTTGSYYASPPTTVYQPVVSSSNPCCDPCATCNPCQTFAPAPVTTFQPVAACPTGFCKNPTLRPGLWGQPSVHIAGQPIRNAFRWLVP